MAQRFEIFLFFNIQGFIYVSFMIVATVVRQRSGLEEAGIGQGAEDFSIFVIYRFCPYVFFGGGFLNATPCQNTDACPLDACPFLVCIIEHRLFLSSLAQIKDVVLRTVV